MPFHHWQPHLKRFDCAGNRWAEELEELLKKNKVYATIVINGFLLKIVPMAPYTAASLKAELNAKGWRLTPQRETMLNIFQNLPRGNHLSAEELHHLLQQGGESISLSTIYRTVKLMARMGILRELELAEGHKHYELNSPYPHHHHHMVCVQCNRTLEFNNDSILKQSLKQASKAGLQLIDCQLTVHTICPEAIRFGWPAMLPSDWSCQRALSDSHSVDRIDFKLDKSSEKYPDKEDDRETDDDDADP